MTTKVMPDIRKHFGQKQLDFTLSLQQDGAGGHATLSHWSYLIEQTTKPPPKFAFKHSLMQIFCLKPKIKIKILF